MLPGSPLSGCLAPLLADLGQSCKLLQTKWFEKSNLLARTVYSRAPLGSPRAPAAPWPETWRAAPAAAVGLWTAWISFTNFRLAAVNTWQEQCGAAGRTLSRSLSCPLSSSSPAMVTDSNRKYLNLVY